MVLRNGVNLAGFRSARDRAAERAELGRDGPTSLSVGYLITRKEHDLANEARNLLPDRRVMIDGSGPKQHPLQAPAARPGMADWLSVVCPVPRASLPCYYAADDILVLASKCEGWANVLLESKACGRPVIASPIPGNPEVV